MIEFKKVSKRFGSQTVLDEVSFCVEKGDIAFVIGKSGMGKSVLLKLIVGLLRPDSGEIFVDEREVSSLSEAEYFDVRKSCGMVFQFPALLDSLTVYENLAFGLRAHRMCSSEEEIRSVVKEKLNLVNLSEKILNRYPTELSYGMQKRVSIARTLAIEPKYLLFDEPTTGSDPVATHAINNLIFSLSKKLKVTSIVVSHDMGSALEIADKILLLDCGKIISQGSVQEMIHSSVPIVKEFLKDVSHP